VLEAAGRIALEHAEAVLDAAGVGLGLKAPQQAAPQKNVT